MAESERWKRGAAKLKEVYCGDVPAVPQGTMAFSDIMLEQLFGEIWTRETLSLRDRRLITMGIIAALGEKDPFCIQVRSGLKNGEFTVEQVREMMIHIAQYAGYPRAAGLLMPTEGVLQEFEKK
jgi:4-carboxymuconolactone decarboxylase